jgi:hypothetical protein
MFVWYVVSSKNVACFVNLNVTAGGDSSVGIATRYGLDPSGQSLAGIAGSNFAGGMDVCVVCCRGMSDVRTENIKGHDG